MPSGTPALAHACAQPLWAAPDAPFVVKQFRSTTWPVSVISLPGVAACPCAASGSAQHANTAVVAMIRFNIVRSSCSEYTERKTPHARGRPAVVSRVPYVPTGGSRLGYIGRHERRLSSTPGDVWPGVGGRGRGYDPVPGPPPLAKRLQELTIGGVHGAQYSPIWNRRSARMVHGRRPRVVPAHAEFFFQCTRYRRIARC